jgi:hypothetical protein
MHLLVGLVDETELQLRLHGICNVLGEAKMK